MDLNEKVGRREIMIKPAKTKRHAQILGCIKNESSRAMLKIRGKRAVKAPAGAGIPKK